MYGFCVSLAYDFNYGFDMNIKVDNSSFTMAAYNLVDFTSVDYIII